jgi:hypothetical protein
MNLESKRPPGPLFLAGRDGDAGARIQSRRQPEPDSDTIAREFLLELY